MNFNDYFEKNHSIYEDVKNSMYEKSFLDRLKLIYDGLLYDKKSGKRKEAILELKRLFAPIISLVVVMVLVSLLLVIHSSNDKASNSILEVVMPDTVEEFDDVPIENNVEIVQEYFVDIIWTFH